MLTFIEQLISLFRRGTVPRSPEASEFSEPSIDAAFNLPFKEAVDFFKGKVPIPTDRWNDLWKEEHAKGFMVAGANRDAILTDFYQAVNKAIEQGTTLQEFRKDFDRIVAAHGWSYKGSRNWRSEVIYSTNIRSAYQAGRWQQMTDPDVLKSRPYLEYRHGDSIHPRPLHLAWNGTILPADDPWWQSHYPQNGWGCKCTVFSVGERDLNRMGRTGPDTAPNDGTYQWTDKKTGEIHTIPNGIDPGFDYNVGIAAYGDRRAKELMASNQKEKFQHLSSFGPVKYGRPDKIPVDAPKAKPFQPEKNDAALRTALVAAIGGISAAIIDPAGEQVIVNQAIVDHILEDPKRLDGREAYFPFIRELIEDPYEIWINFVKSADTGRVALRRKYVKLIRLDKDRVLGLYAEIEEGLWVSGDLFRGSVTGAKNLRKGKLIYGR